MFAAILLPGFCLQAVLRWREELWTQPVAVVDDTTAKGAVLELTPPAAAVGVWPGMASTQALARCGTLQLLPRSLPQEQSLGNALLTLGASLSPRIEATADGICTIDLRQAKISDWNKWASEVLARLEELRLQAQIGVAANPDLALLAARRAAPVLVVQNTGAFLSGLAIAEVDVPPELSAVLRDWGISQLGDLTRVPQSELIDRLGPEAGELWQRAAGQSHRLLRTVQPPEEFSEAFEFEHEVETVEPILFILRRFLDQLTLRLTGAYRVASKMTLILPLEQNGDSPPRSTCAFSPSPRRQRMRRCSSESCTRIWRICTSRSARSPCGCSSSPVTPDNQQLRLFESPLRDPNRFGETLARLTALVGPGRVGVPEPEPTHQPDRFRITEPQFAQLDDTAPPAAENLTLGLPLRRLPPAFAAQVRVIGQVPAQVFSEKVFGEIVDAAGPYRVSGGWWEQNPWSAEEWDIEMSDGALYRLSRASRAGLSKAATTLSRNELRRAPHPQRLQLSARRLFSRAARRARCAVASAGNGAV
jgi:protein ImuB